MAISVLTSAVAGSSDGDTATTSGIDTTGASLLVVAVTNDTIVSTANLSDSKGNTWTALTQYGALNPLRLFYVVNPTVGTGHTFTYSDAVNSPSPSIAVLALSGTDTSAPFDAQNGNSGTGGNTIQPGSLTPSLDNEIVISAVGYSSSGASGTESIDSSFVLQQQVTSSGFHRGLAIATKIQTTAGAENPTWTNTGTFASKSATIACFKAAAGGGTTQPPVAAWTRNTNKIVSCGVF